MFFAPYNRAAAVAYAHRWAYGRNPAFYDYERLGGDCTNFASQCLYAGSGVMDYLPVYGWYYLNANQKSPSWTGVVYLYNYLTRTQQSVGPIAKEVALEELMPGDIIQLSFDGISYQHTPVVVSAQHAAVPSAVFVAAHSYDADNRPLSTYEYQSAKFLHIEGVWKE